MPDWTRSELQEKLQQPLGDSRNARPEISVEIAQFGDGASSLVLDLTVLTGSRPQRWRLTLPGAADDLADASLPSAALIVRANIEEWWHTKDAEPASAQLAQRLD
jgi:hypothetical protein